MNTELFDYVLPPELIAQAPGPRGTARMLVLHSSTGKIEHRQVADLPEFLAPGDLIVLNDTRVSARRLSARRDHGGAAEVLLLRRVSARRWEALVRPGKALTPGKSLHLMADDASPPLTVQVVGVTPDGGRILEFPEDVAEDALSQWGVAPLPPYIKSQLPRNEEARYQTVYAVANGSAAAPTAGLHLTEEMLSQIARRGVLRADLTLHVGIDTFRPVRTDQIEDHTMHGEIVRLDADNAERINGAPGRVLAIGTTSARALEAAGGAAREAEMEPGVPKVLPFCGETRLFITPGYRFRVVDSLFTNFHLPKSTLLMLISALAGRESILRAYQEAIRNRYRFYSFGDAMLIL